MNLYLVKREDEADWDEVEAMVCAAESEDAAMAVHPRENMCGNGWGTRFVPLLKATFLGIAAPEVQGGVVLVDFKAG